MALYYYGLQLQYYFDTIVWNIYTCQEYPDFIFVHGRVPAENMGKLLKRMERRKNPFCYNTVIP